MRKLHSQIILIFALLSISATLFAATPSTPIIQAVTNYSGPIAIFWNTNSNPVATTEYHIYFATTSLLGLTINQMEAGQMIVAYANGQSDMYKFLTTAVAGQTYFFRIAAFDYTNGDPSAAATQQMAATSQTERLFVNSITSTVDGSAGSTLNFDTSTITFVISLKGELGSPFIPPAYVNVDIKTNNTPTSIFASVPKVPVTVTFSSAAFSATATYSWSGNVFVDNSRKHNGNYDIIATPVDRTDAAVTAGQMTSTIGVDVVHTNVGSGLVYTTVSDGAGQNQPHYGPPFIFDYYLSKNSFVTWKIWNRNQTTTTADDTLIRVVVSSAPRVCGDENSSPNGWNKIVQREIWDGRNETGLIVSNDVYRYTFDSAEFWDQPGNTGYNGPSTDRSVTVEGTIAFDVLRLINIQATGITNDVNLAHIKYTLAGTNFLMGGAKINIAIASPGTTFYMALSSGTMSYLQGASTYTYYTGDPVPYNSSNLKKVFSFNRSAGNLDETWNGYDEIGAALPNDTYIFAISAKDDSGNHAIDNSGNDRVIIGNITIDRTASQQAADSTPPSITSVSVGGSTITLSGTNTFSQPFTTIVVSLSDSGGTGVDFTNTSISLTNPSGASVPTTASANDNVGTVTLTYASQSTNGTYSIRIRPTDKAGNSASEVVYSFGISITQSGAQAAFDESIRAYPNPAKNVNSMTFGYTINTISPCTLEIYSITGDLIYKEEWTPATTGPLTMTWNIVNQANKKISTGVYLYRLTTGTSTSKKFKKIVIIQ